MVRTAAFKSYSKVIAVSLHFRHCEERLRRSNPSFPVRLDCFAALAMTSPFNSTHTEPECIFHDAQADLAAERHQRFRMKLHAADRQGLVFDRHGNAVLGARGYR